MSPLDNHNHDSEADLPEEPISPSEFRQMAKDIREVKDVLMTSTPERGCVLDTMRKHDAQLEEHGAQLIALNGQRYPRIILDQAIRTGTQALVLLLLGMIARGFLVSLISESIARSAGAK